MWKRAKENGADYGDKASAGQDGGRAGPSHERWQQARRAKQQYREGDQYKAGHAHRGLEPEALGTRGLYKLGHDRQIHVQGTQRRLKALSDLLATWFRTPDAPDFRANWYIRREVAIQPLRRPLSGRGSRAIW